MTGPTPQGETHLQALAPAPIHVWRLSKAQLAGAHPDQPGVAALRKSRLLRALPHSFLLLIFFCDFSRGRGGEKRASVHFAAYSEQTFHGAGKDRSGNANRIHLRSQFVLHAAIRMVFEKSNRILPGLTRRLLRAFSGSPLAFLRTTTDSAPGPARRRAGQLLPACPGPFRALLPPAPHGTTRRSPLRSAHPLCSFCPQALAHAGLRLEGSSLHRSPGRLVLIPQISAEGPLF